MSKSNHSALEVAEAILYKCNERKIKNVSNKKLQKLLYYVQAWGMVLNWEKVFDDPIEAWVHWPAVKSVYREYRSFNWEPIKLKIKPSVLDSFSKPELSLIDEVLDAYWAFDADYLEELTHAEKPWRDARAWIDPAMWTDMEIDLKSMKEYYSSLV